MRTMGWTSEIERVEYYFDLTSADIALVLHRKLHDMDNQRSKRFLDIMIEQNKWYFEREEKKYTLIFFFSSRRLTPEQLRYKLHDLMTPDRKKNGDYFKK